MIEYPAYTLNECVSPTLKHFKMIFNALRILRISGLVCGRHVSTGFYTEILRISFLYIGGCPIIQQSCHFEPRNAG